MGRTLRKAIAFWCCLVLSFGACNKGDSPKPPMPPAIGNKVYVLCEGSYGNGNASLDIYMPDKDSLYQDVYRAANGKDMGDVLQSFIRIGDNFFLVVNNSDKIIAVRPDLTVHAQAMLAKPRYILPISPTKAYVSSIFTNKVFVFDPLSVTVSSEISLPAMNSEGMLLHGDLAFICPWDTACNSVYIINAKTDQVVDSIAVAGRAPSASLMDKENKLWVLSGNAAQGKPAFWTRIDPATKQILKSFAFPTGADPIRPVMNNTGDSIYFIAVNYSLTAANNGIYRMSIYDNQLPAEPFIPAQPGQYFWALGLHPNGDIYVGDPKGFTQQSSVLIYDAQGMLKKQFRTGIGVGHFYFDE